MKEKELVLVVDDEEMVARATCDMLEFLGYRSTSTSTGQGALDYFNAHADEVSLVILDCKLPDLSGSEVYVEIKKTRPNAPVLMATGLGIEEARLDTLLQSGDSYIQKPYGLKKLGDALDGLIIPKKPPRRG